MRRNSIIAVCVTSLVLACSDSKELLEPGELGFDASATYEITADDGSVYFGGHRYRVIQSSLSWHEAVAHCASIGAHLVTVNSSDENAFIWQLLPWGWLGASDEECEGDWVWVTEEPFSYTNWAIGEPNNCCPPQHCGGDGCTPEHYLTFWGEPYDEQWNDVPDGGHWFLCEWDFGPIDVDIKPGSDPNSVNCTNDNGVITVAILTTEDFDATTVDHATVGFEGASETHVNQKTGEPRRHEEDVDSDGDLDLVFHFRLGDTDLGCASTEGTLTGETFNGASIAGSDAIRMIGKCLPPPAGLVGWWPGDGDADDVVGDNDGTLVNGATFGAGMVAAAFNLDGVDDYVDVPHAENLNFGMNEFSVDLWVKYVTVQGEQILVEKYVECHPNCAGEGGENGTHGAGWSFTKIDDVLHIALRHEDFGWRGVFTQSLAIQPDRWYHAAFTRSGATFTVYWNGEPVQTDVLDLVPDVSSNSSVKFGHRGDPDDTPGSNDLRGFYMNGFIDEVELYNRALSAEEVMAVYEAGSNGKCKRGMIP